MSRIAILSIILIVAVVVPSLVASGVQAATPPVITSVIVTNAIPGNTGLVFLTINGKGFGTGPALVAANGGSGVDTVKGSTHPSVGICDLRGGVLQWNAGGKYTGGITVGKGCVVGGYNDIGVYLNAWTNSQIVLGGFGSKVSFFHIHTGDTLVFVVFGPSNSGASNSFVAYYTGPTA
jgi:hypothetical protein